MGILEHEVTYEDRYLIKTIQIGKDTIENAKYFQREFSFSGLSWSVWDKITIPFYKMKYEIKDIYWHIRYGFQRMFKGYDTMETFEIFDNFIKRYTKILTEYRKHNYGYPGNMTVEEWDNIIDEMIYHLYYMDENNVNEELKKCVPDGWIPCLETSDKIMNKHKDEFFKLFSEYFYNLWD